MSKGNSVIFLKSNFPIYNTKYPGLDMNSSKYSNVTLYHYPLSNNSCLYPYVVERNIQKYLPGNIL